MHTTPHQVASTFEVGGYLLAGVIAQGWADHAADRFQAREILADAAHVRARTAVRTAALVERRRQAALAKGRAIRARLG